jgi:DNA-binding transcriptional LysR family regulator
MELYQLKTFVAVAEEGNLSRAAERLFLSQPAVSGQIKALEEELGLALFLRTPRGMEPTPAGLQLKERALATLKSAEDFLHQAQAVSGRLSGPFRLGHNTDPEYLRIFRVAQEVQQEHPGIALELFKANSGEIRQDLESGRLDAGYIYGPSPHPSVQVELLTRPRLLLAMPASWGEECCTLSLAEVAGRGWLWTPPTCPFHQTVENFLSSQEVEPNRVLAVDDEDMIVTLLRAHKGASFLREDRALDLAARGEARIWQGGELTMPVHVAYLARRAGDPMLRAVLACMRRAWDLPATSC